MVVHRNPHVAAGFDQVAGQADVLAVGAGIAGRVVVDDDDRGGAELDGAGDNLADVDLGLVDRGAPHRLVGEQHVFGVPEERGSAYGRMSDVR